MDDEYRHTGAWNSFKFEPEIPHDDLLALCDRASELGYTLTFREAGYSLEEVKQQLRERGASAFMRLTRIQEDISPKVPQQSAEQFISERLTRLAPESELLITDPYLFTSSRRSDATEYAHSVARIVGPLLNEGVALTLVVDPRPSHDDVKREVLAALASLHPGVAVTVFESNDFHDRFWIADRTRGAIVGTSLNKVGSKIFFIDALTDRDVRAVVEELAGIGA